MSRSKEIRVSTPGKTCLHGKRLGPGGIKCNCCSWASPSKVKPKLSRMKRRKEKEIMRKDGEKME